MRSLSVRMRGGYHGRRRGSLTSYLARAGFHPAREEAIETEHAKRGEEQSPDEADNRIPLRGDRVAEGEPQEDQAEEQEPERDGRAPEGLPEILHHRRGKPGQRGGGRFRPEAAGRPVPREAAGRPAGRR